MHLAFIAPSDQLEHHLVFLIVFMGLAQREGFRVLALNESAR